MRLVFISSVTATRPLRTISVMTGSGFVLRVPAILLFLTPALVPGLTRDRSKLRAWNGPGSRPGQGSARSPRDRNHQISISIDRHRVPDHQHRGRGMLLDQ